MIRHDEAMLPSGNRECQEVLRGGNIRSPGFFNGLKTEG